MLFQTQPDPPAPELPWYEQLGAMDWLHAAAVLFIGWWVASFLARRLGRFAADRLSAQASMLVRRGTYYLGILATLTMTLHQLNFSLTVLLGAAGILTVALGFASQTSASNIISGLFLLGERPFSVGDVIEIGATKGEVLSIDLLAVHLRTFDNIFVRVPNESVIKTEVRTLSRFPIRRYDLQIGVAYKEDLDRVREVLLEVANENPISLVEPPPIVIFQRFGDSSVDLQLSAWAVQANYLQLRNQLSAEVKRRFDAEGIEIPFPHRTLYAGSATDPLPVRLTETRASRET